MNNQIVTIDSHTILVTEEDTGRISFQYPADFDVEGFDVLEIGFVSEATMFGFDLWILMHPSETNIGLVQGLTGFRFIGEYIDLKEAVFDGVREVKDRYFASLLPFDQESFWVERAAKFVDTQENQPMIILTNDD